MKITAIKQQAKQAARYSVFVEGQYAFSLSEGALLESRLAKGQELTESQLGQLKELSREDKVYNRALRYVAARSRSRWEVQVYLERKDTPPPLIENILNKLSILGFIDDQKFAETFIADRQLLRPASRRKIIMELRKKRVADEIIQQTAGRSQTEEEAALLSVIERKRRQSKYQDDQKLIQYLARQGFGYDDIKAALGRR